MKHIYLIIAALFSLILVACGAQSEASQVAPAEIDVANLPDTIDVATAAALQDEEAVLLIDVREQWEYDEGHIPGITHIPMEDVPNRLSEIPTDKTVILTCRSGNRSGQVTNLLRDNGYDNVHNMAGGIVAWQEAGYEVEQ